MTAYEAAQAEFVKRKKAFEAMMREKGHPVRCTSMLRTRAQQAKLYAQGRTTPGKRVTNAKAGESPHNYALAADYVFITAIGTATYTGDWAQFGRVAKLCGLVWGGSWLRFQDRPHIEYPKWKKFKA
jgi:peptidoglycan L-alanyl-D-glutamate endopeptidase CwlK